MSVQVKKVVTPEATTMRPPQKAADARKDELSEAELDKVAGGLNPQPLPPRTRG